MTEKEERVLKIIIEYVKENNIMPTRRFIQKRLNYKSVNSITQYFNSLKNKGYLKYNNCHQLTIGNVIHDNNLKRIKIINSNNQEIELILNKNKDYLGYKLNNNYFKNDYLIKGDILIIEKDKKLHKNDLGLFLIDNKYRVMKYDYQDGFYLLSDKEIMYLNNINIIGKVIKIIKTI